MSKATDIQGVANAVEIMKLLKPGEGLAEAVLRFWDESMGEITLEEIEETLKGRKGKAA
jgi:hypothetical protein